MKRTKKKQPKNILTTFKHILISVINFENGRKTIGRRK